MPIREYVCKECGDRFERACLFKDPHPEACRKCGGALRQIFHTFTFKFRRRGWKPYSPETSVREEKVESTLLPEDWHEGG